MGGFDLDTNTVKVMLLDNTYSFDEDAHEYIDDVSGDEIVGTGYTAGGATLGSKALAMDDANDWAYFDAADVTWTTATLADVRYAVVYKDTGTPATSPILCIFDFGSDKNITAADFKITWDSGGILRIR